ncbi:MAG: hypothetical protein VKJ04_10755 [Vampirovibrionales bacterium]|nr:hypothetical protein [Vampirovibrionales bacterium]
MSTSSITPGVPAATTTGKAGPKNPGTQRLDNWFTEPVLTFGALVLFAIYVTWRALQGFVDANHYYLTANHRTYLEQLGYLFTQNGAHYVSPFAAPDLSPILLPLISPVNHWIQDLTGWKWLVFSPALWLLWAPGGFRLTCYFYRRAYYRSFFSAPAACAVNTQATPTAPVLGCVLGKGSDYKGERSFPMILVNLHRYFFYVAALFIVIHTVDAFISYFFQGQAVVEAGKTVGHQYQVGVGLGSIMITLDAVFLALYTFSCHSYRHLLGGMLDSFSAWGIIGKLRHHAWQRQSILNEHHMFFAWLSMGWVVLVDFYIWQLAQGNLTDPRFTLPFTFTLPI